MKLVYIFLAVLAFGGINDIAKMNSLKQEAQKAYDAGEYETALEKYQYLVDSMDVDSDEIKLNMAHAYFHVDDTANARSYYQELSQSDNKKIKSSLGVLSDKPESMDVALDYFKEALKTDPSNEEARYNYEVLKKRMKEQEQDQQQQDQENKDKNQDKEDEKEQEQKSKEEQEKEDNKEEKEGDKKEQDQKDGQKEEQEDKKGEEEKDGESKEQKEGEEEKKEGEEQDKENEKEEGEEKEGEEGKQEEEKKDEKGAPKSAEQKLKEMNISPQQAKMILEAMKGQEVQYLQQLKRRPTKKRDSGKPDW